MKVLIIGGGGREHALAWKIAQSPLLSQLWLAPGNPGMNALGAPTDLDVCAPDAVRAFCDSHAVDLAVIGPEAPLAAGVVDALTQAGRQRLWPRARRRPA